MVEYEEFYRDESDLNQEWSDDTLSTKQPTEGGDWNTAVGSIGMGGGTSVIGGKGWGQPTIIRPPNGKWEVEPKPKENGEWETPALSYADEGWVKITDFIWDFDLKGILTSNGRILKRLGKLQKHMKGRMGFEIFGTLGDIETNEHVDCVVVSYLVNGKEYNMSQNQEAAEKFFEVYWQNPDFLSKVILQAKFQRGHYPLDIDMLKLKFKQLNNKEFVTGWMKLNKEFHPVKEITFQSGLVKYM